MSSNDNERIFRRYVEEAVNGGNMDVFEELVAQDFVDHDPNEALFVDEGPEGETLRERSRRHLLELRDAAPDLHYTLDDVRAAGERVSFRWVATGTHRGPYLGFPPTGK